MFKPITKPNSKMRDTATFLLLLLAGEVPESKAETCAQTSGFVHAAQITRNFTAALEITSAQGQKTDAAAFFISADGTLATAAHVLTATSAVTVLMPDHSRATAKLIAADPLSDIALLKVSTSEKIIPAHIRETALELGEPVAAVGSPLGYQQSLTAGIVSALDRPYGATTPYGFIQHDAALNPGSSGGPLVDKNGEVVGMNVAIADGARRNVGVSLAVPAALVQTITARLLQGKIPRATLGLQLRDSTSMKDAIPELAHGGVLVEAVVPQSAAEISGLRPGDVILRAANAPVKDTRDLAKIIEPLAPGDVVELTVLRDGVGQIIALKLGMAVEEQTAKLTRTVKIQTPHFGISLEKSGTKIDAVEPNSAAAKTGLLKGDDILAVGIKVAVSAAQVNALLADMSSPKALLVQREGVTRYVIIGAQGRLDSTAGFGANAEANTSSSL